VAVDQPVSVPENSSVIKVDEFTKSTTLFVTGGVTSAGAIVNWVFGL